MRHAPCLRDRKECEVITILLGVAARSAGVAKSVRHRTIPVDTSAWRVAGLFAPIAILFCLKERHPEMHMPLSSARSVTAQLAGAPVQAAPRSPKR